MPPSPSHHAAPSATALARLAALLAPGSRPTNVRPLGGGVMMAMHSVDLVLPAGTRRRLVIRRCPPGAPPVFAAFLRHGWRVLELLAAARLPAPRPVYADLAGTLFDGVPTIVMTRVPGRSDLTPPDLDAWWRRLGTALAALHTTPLMRLTGDVLSAEDSFVDDLFAQMTPAGGGPTRFDAHPDGAAIVAALQRWRPHLQPLAPTAIHGDFCPENTLWSRGRLRAIVDWDFARIDHPGVDVGYARMGLALLFGPTAPNRFLAGYEVALGRSLPEPFFWDLLGAGFALPDPARRLRRYHALGRTDLSEPLLRERLRAFIATALHHAEQAAPP